jgi:cysteine desulfurase
MTISLDYHATTPAAPEVIEAMAPYWREAPWNAHSPHAGGALAEAAVASARASVADLVGANPSEIIFTSGATEANNIAILGLAIAACSKAPTRRRILTSAIEHKCILEAARHLSNTGFEHELIPVLPSGLVDLDALDRLLADDVLLVAVMAANNEVGSIQPLSEVARRCAEHGALLHVDAAQAVGRIPFDVVELGCDTASLSAHKMYGPKGIGGLFVSATTPLRPEPVMFGGGQEQGLRPGTLPVPLIVGFGKAAALAAEHLSHSDHLERLAASFLAALEEEGLTPQLNGSREQRLPGSLNLRFVGIDAEDVVQRLGRRLHLSTGSACQSGQLQGSYVLRAMGLSSVDVSSSFRICFGRDHRDLDARQAAKLLAGTIHSCQNGAGQDVQQRETGGGPIRIGRF